MEGVVPPDRWVGGYIAANLLLLGTVLGTSVAKWVTAHPQPQAMVDVLTAARFSLLDVLGACLFLLVVASAVAATRWLPRY